ncbi:hypothetical protein [Nitrospirillum viridazoti]|uniref:Uncharacterized protein n=1 Tax=Nitrospirillum viridazoti CBAmc TaxID=1441467 RepID=A0A248JW59_9PROT|nr:hypothetical protein [Nitrospirillum amazonense]ASG22756.1 hypothetical protein Y958_17775 [Nitrospirillum amazonense CBAmc]TWB33791.1 hypothetical protein FBZ91_113143 [Nitrospirillum amazonense]
MTVEVVGNVIHLRGVCAAEDAEALLSRLQAAPQAEIDVTACRHLHGAVVQVLLAFRPNVRGMAEDIFLRDWVIPNLAAHR